MSAKVDAWLAEKCKGRSFADVGGLWGIVNEKVTLAIKAGATKCAMIDHVPETDYLWDEFLNRIGPPYEVGCLCVDVEDRDIANRVSRKDVVHCNGLLYHSANPINFMQNLASITGEYLAIGSIHSGRIPGATGSLLVPCNAGRDWYSQLFQFPAEAPAYGISVEEPEWFLPSGRPNARPFWWLHSKITIMQMINLVGFEVEDEEDDWDGRVVKYMCRRKS